MMVGARMNSGFQFQRGLELCHAAIDRLPTDLRAALAAACTQRQAEVYRTYAMRTRSRISADFDDLLGAIWAKIHNREKLGPGEHSRWQGRAERLYPGDNAKPDIYLGCAQIAVLSLLHSNRVLATEEARDTCSSAHEAFMSIYNSLVSPIGQTPQFDLREEGALERVFEHPLIEAEHRRQERDLFEIEQASLRPSTIPDVVSALRKRSEIEARDFLPLIGVG
jgi:hypothetical protein